MTRQQSRLRMLAGLLLAAALITAVWALGALDLLPSWQQVTAWWRLWWQVALGAVTTVGLLIGAVIIWRMSQRAGTQPAGLPPVAQPERGGLDWTRIASLITALTALATLLFTAQSLRATEQGQAADRFNKAVEQLGSQGVDVRQGGIRALAGIAHDSPEDQPAIIKVLADFIRNHTPLSDFDTCVENSVAPDVQDALTVLGRRNPQYDANVTINLDSTCLSGVDLTGANLGHAQLTSANLFHADLTRANLSGAHLEFTDFNSTDFTDADLTDVDLTEAKLNHTVFVDTHLARANLTRATDGGDDVDFTGADLTDADLTGAYLVNPNLMNANLTGVDQTVADLSGAKR